MNIGERIRELREGAGFTQNKLADCAGVSQTHLRRVERGEADITDGHLRLISGALQISLKDFFNVNDDAEDLTAAIANLSPRQRQLLLSFLKSL